MSSFRWTLWMDTNVQIPVAYILTVLHGYTLVAPVFPLPPGPFLVVFMCAPCAGSQSSSTPLCWAVIRNKLDVSATICMLIIICPIAWIKLSGRITVLIHLILQHHIFYSKALTIIRLYLCTIFYLGRNARVNSKIWDCVLYTLGWGQILDRQQMKFTQMQAGTTM